MSGTMLAAVCMNARSAVSAKPSLLVRSRGPQSPGRPTTPPPTRSIRRARFSSSTPRQRSGRRRGASQPSTMLASLNGSWPFKPRESHKWEPTPSDVLGRTPTQSECSRRSRAPHATWSDDARHSETSPDFPDATRKRSLVQIQYCPPGISYSWPYQGRSVALQLALQRALHPPSSTQPLPAPLRRCIRAPSSGPTRWPDSRPRRTVTGDPLCVADSGRDRRATGSTPVPSCCAAPSVCPRP